jgi:hypothetical protein
MPWLFSQAVSAAAAMVEGSLEDNLSKFLKKNIIKKELTDDVRAIFSLRSFCNPELFAQASHDFAVCSWASLIASLVV